MESIEVMPIRIRIASILKKAIYSGEYKSGEELSLTAIAEQLGVSRTPVREAFQQLAADGLITLRMNKGAIINTIDYTFIKDIFDMRVLLEGEAAFRAAEKNVDVSFLIERVIKLQDEINQVEKSEYVKLNQDIHMSIWSAAGNKRLMNYLMDLWNGPSTGHSQPEERDHYRKSTEEHLIILDAIQTCQPEKARSAMVKHITRSMDNILQYYPKA